MTVRLALAAALAAVAVPLAGSASACGPRTLILCVVQQKACEALNDISPGSCGGTR